MSFARSQNLNIYHQSESLLFQFILSEFIDSYREILIVNNLNKSLFPKNIPFLKLSITKLAGSTDGHRPLFSWSQKDGILSRLKNYCSFLLLQNKKQNQTILKMQQQINQAFLNCIQSLDTIQMAEESLEPEKHQQSLQKLLKKLILPMQRFSKLTASLMQEFHSDENVLFFMLKHQSDFDHLFGPQFCLKFFNKMYPKGIDDLSEFLLKRYTLRGFDHLIPRIKKKIAELKKK